MLKNVELTEALARKYPEWVVFVIAAGPDGKANLMPAGWVAFASGSPPMATVAIHPNRHTHKLIEQSGEFVLAWAGQGQEEAIKLTGATHGWDTDKFAQLNLKTVKAAKVKAPLLEGCAFALECKVEGRMTAGDHTVFAGRILAAHVSDPPIPMVVNFGKERYLTAKP